MIFSGLLPSNSPSARLDDLKRFRIGLFCYLEHGDVRGEWDRDEAQWKRARGGRDTEDILAASAQGRRSEEVTNNAGIPKRGRGGGP